MNEQTVSENEPNNNFEISDEDIMRQKEAMRLFYESLMRGKHSKQKQSKGCFGGSRKPRYKAQSRN